MKKPANLYEAIIAREQYNAENTPEAAEQRIAAAAESISTGTIERLRATGLYMNRETGELLTGKEMQAQAAALCDVDDPTNALNTAEYYTAITL